MKKDNTRPEEVEPFQTVLERKEASKNALEVEACKRWIKSAYDGKKSGVSITHVAWISDYGLKHKVEAWLRDTDSEQYMYISEHSFNQAKRELWADDGVDECRLTANEWRSRV